MRLIRFLTWAIALTIYGYLWFASRSSRDLVPDILIVAAVAFAGGKILKLTARRRGTRP